MHIPTANRPHPLRVYRVSKSLSQQALAEASGVARSTIIRLEAGDEPTIKTANAIANVLGVSRLALFPPDQGDEAD